MRIWNAVSAHLCYRQAEAKAKATGYQSAADHYIKMLGSLSKSYSPCLKLWTITSKREEEKRGRRGRRGGWKKKEKKDSLPEVPSCNQQKVVLNTGQQIAAFLSNAGAAKELHSWARLTPSSCPYLCNVQLFTFPCSKPTSFHLFSPCMSTDRACGNSILCTWPAVQFHYANDNADN